MNWQERAEKAEAELAKLREQKPVRWHVRGNYFHDGDAAILFASRNPMCGAKVERLYAAPVPEQREGNLAVAAVPEEWCDKLLAEFPLLDDEGLCQEKHHCEWTLQQDRKRLHTLLQSTPQEPTVPDDRVSQDESTLTMAASALVLFRAGESAEYMAKAIEALLQSAPQSGSEPVAHHPV